MALELFLLLVCIAEAVGELVHALANSGAFAGHGWKPGEAPTEPGGLGSTETLPATVGKTATRAQLPFLASNLGCGSQERKSGYTGWTM